MYILNNKLMIKNFPKKSYILSYIHLCNKKIIKYNCQYYKHTINYYNIINKLLINNNNIDPIYIMNDKSLINLINYNKLDSNLYSIDYFCYKKYYKQMKNIVNNNNMTINNITKLDEYINCNNYFLDTIKYNKLDYTDSINKYYIYLINKNINNIKICSNKIKKELIIYK